MGVNLENIDDLEALRGAVEAFDGCGLKRFANRTVFGDGNPDSGVVLIGEAPGAQEDLQGKPFVGRSGQLLDKMLATVGLDRRGVYITNTVFWRPPENRTPMPDEILSCRPFLLKHLELLRPKVLVLVGGTAVKAVLQRAEPMGKMRQKWHVFEVPKVGMVPMMAMFHPAFLLRNPPAKQEAMEDLKMLRRKLEELGMLEAQQGGDGDGGI